ncbi:transcriptional regulator [Rhizobium tubonense]|uniref:Transcriptional regulator n=2 Tax=Rhizobium tubonense TaxID=484088 RepID=A0A2W4DAV7_9HYPH|nr:transcriptional regulator [Rhizobium tubonense]
MLVAPPTILQIAREFLGLSQDQVAALSGVSRKTIQRAEKGDQGITRQVARLQQFYESNGIEFVPPATGKGWGIFNHNTIEDPLRLNRLPEIKTERKKKTSENSHSLKIPKIPD